MQAADVDARDSAQPERERLRRMAQRAASERFSSERCEPRAPLTSL